MIEMLCSLSRREFVQNYWMILTLLLTIGRPALASEQELPSLDAVIARVRQTEGLLQTLQVHEVSEYRQRGQLRRQEIFKMPQQCDWTFAANGRELCVARGELLKSGPVKEEVEPFRMEWGSDGTVVRILKYATDEPNRVFSARVDDFAPRIGVFPLIFTVLWNGESTIAEELSSRPSRVIGWNVHDGRTVVEIAEEPVEAAGKLWARQTLIDMDRGTNVKVAFLVKRNSDDAWIEHAVWSGYDYQEMARGVWLPHRFRFYSFSIFEDASGREFQAGCVGAYRDWKVNSTLSDVTFKPLFPENIPVNDHRSGADGVLLGNAEIQALNERSK